MMTMIFLMTLWGMALVSVIRADEIHGIDEQLSRSMSSMYVSGYN